MSDPPSTEDPTGIDDYDDYDDDYDDYDDHRVDVEVSSGLDDDECTDPNCRWHDYWDAEYERSL